jgi:hypothetical protein
MGHVTRMGEMRNANKIILVGKREGQKPLGRYMYRWNNIKMDFKNFE